MTEFNNAKKHSSGCGGKTKKCKGAVVKRGPGKKKKSKGGHQLKLGNITTRLDPHTKQKYAGDHIREKKRDLRWTTSKEREEQEANRKGCSTKEGSCASDHSRGESKGKTENRLG